MSSYDCNLYENTVKFSEADTVAERGCSSQAKQMSKELHIILYRSDGNINSPKDEENRSNDHESLPQCNIAVDS